MFSSRNDYDYGVSTFSPEGRIQQVQYALKAIERGSTAIAIQTKDSVIFAVEKRLPSKLCDPASVRKTFHLDRHIACAMSGLVSDARILVQKGREAAVSHEFDYNERISVPALTRAICDECLLMDSEGPRLSRPFGVGLLIGGIDENGPSLYVVDPAGSMVKCVAHSLGAGAKTAQKQLEKLYTPELSDSDAINILTSIIKSVVEEQLSVENVEILVVHTNDSGKVICETVDEDSLKELIDGVKNTELD